MPLGSLNNPEGQKTPQSCLCIHKFTGNSRMEYLQRVHSLFVKPPTASIPLPKIHCSTRMNKHLHTHPPTHTHTHTHPPTHTHTYFSVFFFPNQDIDFGQGSALHLVCLYRVNKILQSLLFKPRYPCTKDKQQ